MYIKNADQCAFWLGEAKYKEAIETLNKYDGGNLSDMPRQPKKNSKFPVVPSFIPAGNTESDGTDFFNINDISIFGAIIDFDCLLETQDIYGETWPIQYLKFLNMVYSDRNRLMNLEFGDSFSLGITNEFKTYTWGLNDSLQLGRLNRANVAHVDPGLSINLSAITPKMVALGADHGIA